MSRETAAAEVARIRGVYSARSQQVDQDLYGPWQPSELLFVSERRRVAAGMLRALGRFPVAGDVCLEIGYGRIGWLADMIAWGLRAEDLAGIELDDGRGSVAKRAIPGADLRIGNAAELPWPSGSFRFVVVSTVFSSILDVELRYAIADEIDRVLRADGAIIWYDLAVNNPKNPAVRGIGKNAMGKLFPGYDAVSRSVTLAPPIARFVAPKSFTLAVILSSLPFLRTHHLAILTKKDPPTRPN